MSARSRFQCRFLATGAAACGVARSGRIVLSELLIITILISALIPFACSRHERSTPAGHAPPIERVIERGPVKVNIQASKEAVTVGEHVTLTVDVLAEPGVDVQMPRIGEKLGAFEIVQSRTPPDIPEGVKRRWTHSYVARTLESGQVMIPSLSIAFNDHRDATSPAIAGELATPEIVISVRSLVASDADVTTYRDIKDAVDVEVPMEARSLWMWGGAIVVGALAIAAATIVVRRYRRKAALPAPALPPHIWAYKQFSELASQRLVEAGEFDLFFYKLSTIVRQYIEKRFNILAAEQTTDEFLRDARTQALLSTGHRTLLKDFLRLADMVKFARYIPPRAQSEQVFAAAREFVDQTAPRVDEQLPRNDVPTRVEVEAAA
jgi:hypothetical protein